MVMALVRGMSHTKHTAVTTGLTMGQISEFSLILAALGLNLGHIDKPAMGLITLIGLITFGLSTYMILYSHWLYRWLVPALGFLKPGTRSTVEKQVDSAGASPSSVNTIVFGLGRYGRNLVQELRQRGTTVLSVDFDPERVKYWRERGLVAVYGDLEDIELLHDLPLADARWVVNTIPGRDKCLVLLHALEHSKFSGRTALTADTMRHREFLLAAGADVVLLPFRDAAAEAASMLTSHSEPLPAPVPAIDKADDLETVQDDG